MSQDPVVYVLLINWNTWRDTIECLESLFRQDYAAYHVILCDNGSTDGSVDRIIDWARGVLAPPPAANGALGWLSSPPVPKPVETKILSIADCSTSRCDARLTVVDARQNLGFSGGTNIALNLALRSSEHGYAWLVNNDMVVAPDALSLMVEHAKSDPELGAVGGEILEYRDPDVIQIPGGGHASLWNGFPMPSPVAGMRHGAPGAVEKRLDFIAYGCMLSPLSAIRRVGVLDERYFLYCEDIDHSLRFRNAGYRLSYAPSARVWHKGGASIGYRSSRHDFYMSRNTLLLVSEFAPARLGVAFVYSVYRCVLPKILRGQWSRLKAVLSGYASFVRDRRKRSLSGDPMHQEGAGR